MLGIDDAEYEFTKPSSFSGVKYNIQRVYIEFDSYEVMDLYDDNGEFDNQKIIDIENDPEFLINFYNMKHQSLVDLAQNNRYSLPELNDFIKNDPEPQLISQVDQDVNKTKILDPIKNNEISEGANALKHFEENKALLEIKGLETMNECSEHIDPTETYNNFKFNDLTNNDEYSGKL